MSDSNDLVLLRNRYRPRFYQNRKDDLPDLRHGTNVLSAINNYFDDTRGEPSRPLDSFVASPSFADISTSSRIQNYSQLEENSPTNLGKSYLHLVPAGERSQPKIKVSSMSKLQKSRKNPNFSKSDVNLIPCRKLYEDKNMEPDQCVERMIARNRALENMLGNQNSAVQEAPRPMSVTPLRKLLDFDNGRATNVRSSTTSLLRKCLMDNSNVHNPVKNITEREPEIKKKVTKDFVLEEEANNPNELGITLSAAGTERTEVSTATNESLNLPITSVLEQCPESSQQEKHEYKDLSTREPTDQKRHIPARKCKTTTILRAMAHEQKTVERKFPLTLAKEAFTPSEGVPSLDTNDGPGKAEDDEFIICDITETDKFSVNQARKSRKCRNGKKTGLFQKNVDVDIDDKQFSNESSNLGIMLEDEGWEDTAPSVLQNETFVVPKKAQRKSSTSKRNSEPKHPLKKQKNVNSKSKMSAKTSNKSRIDNQGVKNMMDVETDVLKKQFVTRSIFDDDNEKSREQLDVENDIPKFLEDVDLDGFAFVSSRASAESPNMEAFNPLSKSLQQSKGVTKNNTRSSKNEQQKKCPQTHSSTKGQKTCGSTNEQKTKVASAQASRQVIKGKNMKHNESSNAKMLGYNDKKKLSPFLKSSTSGSDRSEDDYFENDFSDVSEHEIQNLPLENTWRPERHQNKKRPITNLENIVTILQNFDSKAIAGPSNAKILKLNEHDEFHKFSKPMEKLGDKSPESHVGKYLPDFQETFTDAQIFHSPEAAKLVNARLNVKHQNILEFKDDNNTSKEQQPLQYKSPQQTPSASGQSHSRSRFTFQSGPVSRTKAVQNKNSDSAVRELAYSSTCDSEDQLPLAIVFDPDTKSETVAKCLNRMSSEEHLQTEFRGIWRCFKNNIFTAGKMVIRPSKEQSRLSPEFDILVFYIVRGKVNLKIDKTWYFLKTADFFYIPPCNTFIIRNTTDENAELVFTQLNNHCV